MDWIVQLVPFQLSANGPLPALEAVSPTAVQAADEAHDTPKSKVLLAPVGFGVGWMVHELPFQRSAKLTVPELPLE
jgi:hypothetical protein